MSELTQERVRDALSYCEDTGLFHWRRPRAGRMSPGDLAGTTTDNGYIVIWIDRKRYLAHRLAWLYVTGSWPEIADHINGKRSDNRIANLRSTTHAGNSQNRKFGRGSSQYLGVSWDKKDKKWRATIKAAGRKIHLGHFASEALAHEAYQSARDVYHTQRPAQ